MLIFIFLQVTRRGSGYSQDYSDKFDTRVANSVATAAFRYGHIQVRIFTIFTLVVSLAFKQLKSSVK